MRKNFPHLMSLFIKGFFISVPLLALCLFSSINASAQIVSETLGQTGNYGTGITETVNQIMERGKALELSGALHPTVIRQETDVNRNPAQNLESPAVATFASKDATMVSNKAKQKLTATGSIGTNFTSNTYNSGPGYVPPDAQGCVGPSQIVAIANGFIAVYSKSGILGGLNTGTDNFFTSVLGGSSASDPHIHFDPISQRWFITMINVATVDRIMIAVSSGPTITGTSSFTFFEFEHDLVGTTPNSDTGGFADYDTFGVDGNALYIGANIFGKSGSFIGTTAYVINKANLLKGKGTLTVTPFRQLCTATGAGPFTPQGVDNDDPTATTGYFIGVDNAKYGLLDVRRITNPGGTPSISGNLQITVPTTAAPENIASLGSVKLDPDDDRLFQATMHINTTTGLSTLWTSHHIRATNKGVGSSSGTVDAVRWYEIKNLTTTPALNQSGTLYDASSSSIFYTYGTIAENSLGNAEIGATVSGANTAINCVVAGHAYSGAAGSTDAPVALTTNTTKYTITFDGSPHRWGDYSAVNLDPSDELTLWAFTETATGGVWGEQATQIMAPPTAPIKGITHPVNSESNIEEVQIIGDNEKGGFFESSPLATNHMKIDIGGGVQVLSKNVDNDGQITVKVSTKGVAPGNYDITVTNPDGQTSTLTRGFVVAPVSTVTEPLHAEIYPNPAQSNINIALAGGYKGDLQITISDGSGKTVIQNKISEFDAQKMNHLTQDISHLSAGVYFVNLS